jgi:ferredoxin
MSDPKAAQLKSELKAFATERGADGVGIVSVAAFEAKVPNLQKPSSTGLGYHSIVAFYRHMLTGAFVTRNVPLQSLNGHLTLDDIERLQMELIDWLERRGHLGVAPPPESAFLDLDPRKPMGTLDLKWVCEEAGIGTVGLNLNFLSPNYASRVYIGCIMTDAEMEPDPPLERDLCPGVSCGRCGVVCPPDAIPRDVALGAGLREYRTLDKRQCSLGAERIGIRSIHLNLESVLNSDRPFDADAVLESPYMRDWWQSVNSKVGAFAACFECMYVCPMGDDYKPMYRAPERVGDLPKPGVKHDKQDGRHKINWLGPPAERVKIFNRDSELGKALET